ncbi:MAG TPA: hypothetical protein VF276_18515, partial [Chloroflexia bacterium]
PATAPPATGSTTTSRRRTRTPAPAAEPATPAPGTPALGTPLAAAAAAPAAAVASAAAQAAPADATTTPTSTTTRRRRAASAASAAPPPAVAPESPAPAPPAPPAATEATSTRPRTGTARRATKAAADTPTPLPMPAAPVPPAAPAAPPEAAVARAMPPAAAAPASLEAPQARALEAGPMPVPAAGAAVVPPAPPPAAPPREAAGAPALQPVTRRNPVPFIAVGAGVLLLLILAAVFGPGLLGARTGGAGSPTPAATAPPTAASLPSATSGLPVGAVASATPAQVAGGEPTLAPTEPATTAPTTAPPSPVPATAAPTAMEMPTPAAIPPTTSQGAVGGLRFTDNGQHVVDQAVVTLTLDTLPAPPAGQGRVAGLVSSATGANLNLGRITPDAKGAATLTFTDTQGANLLAGYDGFVVTNEALEGTPFAPSSDVVLHGQLPVQAMVHISHLLVSYPDTPGQVGLEVGLRAQVNALVDHAQQLSGAQATGNLATVKQEAEAIANLIEGSKAPNYGDLNKDGQITDPGDGFGFLQNGTHDGYLLGVKDHAELSAAAPDATDTVKQHAEGVAITTDNVRDWVTQIRDKARAIIAAPNTTATRQLASDILDLATAVEQGRSIGTDGNIQPVKGSGGAITSYQEALHMADMPIQPAK